MPPLVKGLCPFNTNTTVELGAAAESFPKEPEPEVTEDGVKVEAEPWVFDDTVCVTVKGVDATGSEEELVTMPLLSFLEFGFLFIFLLPTFLSRAFAPFFPFFVIEARGV